MPADLRGSVTFHQVDRGDAPGLAATFGEGADLLLDCVCFTAKQARELLPLARRATSTVMISTKAVYVDGRGNHSGSEEPPNFPGPVTEDQPTLAPGDMYYDSREGYGPNKVAAEHVLLDSGLPVTVLRPSKIHGEGARPARSWAFVKRVIDQRPVVLLAGRGLGADHPTAAVNIAALVETAALQPSSRILNVADPDHPNGNQIAGIVADYLRHTWDRILLDDDAPSDLGRHPWDRRPPVRLDTTSAVNFGYRPVGDFASTIGNEIDWLMAIANHGELDEAHAETGAGTFDYAAEDRYLAP